MKPAGPERDREIAEVRGDFDNGCGKPHFYRDCDNNCFNCATRKAFKLDKPYSTDIACAMELELPCNKYHELTYKKSDGFFVEIWHQSKLIFTSEVNISEAIAKADARSGAYLKWKEGA
jgi:hypothetical protein